MIPAAHSRLFLVAKKSIKNVRSRGIYSAALSRASTNSLSYPSQAGYFIF